MSEFSVEVYPVIITDHPNADAIELAQIGGYNSIVQKNLYKTGDLVAYIPCSAIVPDDIIEELGLTGKLSGGRRNRVKEIKLRGILSEGVVYPAREHWSVGDDVTDELGITKYIPKVPGCLDGVASGEYADYTFKYDIENLKKNQSLFNSDDEVVITEKLHGTLLMCVAIPDQNEVIVTSKGLAGKGMNLIWNEENAHNQYIKMAEKLNLREIAMEIAKIERMPVYIIGELYGNGIQDLTYGCEETDFRVFDMAVGTRNTIQFLDYWRMVHYIEGFGLTIVPEVYLGPFDMDVVNKLTDGRDTLSGTHMREGVVIKNISGQRKILKSVSAAYLLRKNGTEYN